MLGAKTGQNVGKVTGAAFGVAATGALGETAEKYSKAAGHAATGYRAGQMAAEKLGLGATSQRVAGAASGIASGMVSSGIGLSGVSSAAGAVGSGLSTAAGAVGSGVSSAAGAVGSGLSSVATLGGAVTGATAGLAVGAGALAGAAGLAAYCHKYNNIKYRKKPWFKKVRQRCNKYNYVGRLGKRVTRGARRLGRKTMRGLRRAGRAVVSGAKRVGASIYNAGAAAISAGKKYLSGATSWLTGGGALLEAGGYLNLPRGWAMSVEEGIPVFTHVLTGRRMVVPPPGSRAFSRDGTPALEAFNRMSASWESELGPLPEAPYRLEAGGSHVALRVGEILSRVLTAHQLVDLELGREVEIDADQRLDFQRRVLADLLTPAQAEELAATGGVSELSPHQREFLRDISTGYELADHLSEEQFERMARGERFYTQDEDAHRAAETVLLSGGGFEEAHDMTEQDLETTYSMIHAGNLFASNPILSMEGGGKKN